jgi:hypothetical protein
MIWDANSSKMEEPNVAKWEQSMGFHTSTTIVQGIFKGAHRRIFMPPYTPRAIAPKKELGNGPPQT